MDADGSMIASQSFVARQWRNAILDCALDITRFAILCDSAIGGAHPVRMNYNRLAKAGNIQFAKTTGGRQWSV